ncbi:MAG: hypothetical protein JST19_02030 [Bacteroidetes bacterium]|nr:hypothetical protein [Bacteroidota bacterium]
MKRYRYLLLILFSVLLVSSCNRFRKRGLPFGSVKGVHFTEVRRAFSNGLVFDKQGYQLEPGWKLYFISDDSAQVFSPKMQRYYGFHVYFDHDSIFNTADTWLKLRRISPDSLVFQAQRVENRIILDEDEGSNVFMTFYSDDYIRRNGPDKVARMGQPGRKDTLFIQKRSALANRVIDSAFSARMPALLTSNSPLVTVEKVKSESTPLNKVDPSINYMYPEFNITIHKAYEEFEYSFSVFVDDKGGLHFGRTDIPYQGEFKKTYEDVMKGIIDGYLKRYVDVTPGTTLGIAHASYIYLDVRGLKN